jgi:hypothetical protein
VSFNSMVEMLSYRPPAEAPIGVPRKVALRRARNRAFREKSLRKARFWKTPQACHAKYRLRRQRWEEAPHRLAYATMIPLIRHYRQRRGLPVPDIQRVPENDFDFWIEWLEWVYSEAIPTAAAFREANVKAEQEVREPIKQLIRALTDCRDGVRSRYTERFFFKNLRGRKRDTGAIEDYKAGIGAAYKVLSTVGTCSRSQAIVAIQREMRRMGFIEMPVETIPEYARKVSKKQYIDGCQMFIRGLFNYDDNPLLELFPRQDVHQYVAVLNQDPDLWRKLVAHPLKHLNCFRTKRRGPALLGDEQTCRRNFIAWWFTGLART